VNLGKYIHKLLLEHETVIIPGFGAFISSYKPAEINSESNELKPPSKEIFFNQQIRNNDSLLVGTVALGEGVSHFDALKLIEKERENILYQLDKGEKYTLEDTGELLINEQDEITLNPFIEDNLLLDSFGLEAVSLDNLAQEEENIIIAAKDGEQAEKEQTSTQKEEVDVVPASVQLEPKKEEPQKKEAKKRGWLLVLLALIPIGIVGIYFIYQNRGNNTIPEKTIEHQVATEKEPEMILDTIVKDTTPAFVQDTSKTEETIPVSPDLIDENLPIDSPKYYLVSGSFTIEENAETYIEELKAKGFDAFNAGKKGRFFIVGIGSYASFKEANSQKTIFMEENPGSEVWVWKR